MATSATCVSFVHPEHNPDGEPPRFHDPREKIVIAMGGAAPVVGDSDEAKWVDDRDDWLKANAGYFAKTGGRVFRPVMVKDSKRDPREYRVWMLRTEVVGERWTVQLKARFELSDGHGALKVFRGQHAHVADPLRMSRSILPVVAAVSEAEQFDRVEASARIRRRGGKVPWGTVSRVFAHMHNYGLIESVGSSVYGLDHPDARLLSDHGDGEHATGSKSSYRKTGHWSHFAECWGRFLASKGPETDIYDPLEPLSSAAA